MLRTLRSRRFAALYSSELPFVWTVLRRLGVPEAHVEDAAHDVFVVVHRQLDDFEGRSSERTWLYSIARRIAWRHRRSQRRRDRRHAALAALASARVEPEQDEAVRRREATVLLNAFLESLDRPKREAFVLGELERLPRTSLGHALGVSPGTAYTRLRAARADFAQAFGPEGPRGPVRRLARALEHPPHEARARLWLALPGMGLGRAAVSKLALGLVSGAAALGVAAVVIAKPEPQPEPVVAARLPPHVRAEPVAAASPAKPRATAPTTSVEPSEPPTRARAVTQAPRTTEPSKPRATPAIPPQTRESPSSSDSLVEEAAVLGRARTAIAAQRWDDAWTELRSHAQRFPTGTLATERELSSITVACHRGDDSGALSLARAVLPRLGPSARSRLRSSCVGDRLSGDDSAITPDPSGDREG